MAHSEQSIRMSQNVELVQWREGKAYPIPCDEWDYLKRRIGEVSNHPNPFHTLGSLLLGAALSTLITILLGGIAVGQASVTIAWAVTAVTLISGIIALVFAYKQDKVEKVQARNVLDQMAIIERRYKALAD